MLESKSRVTSGAFCRRYFDMMALSRRRAGKHGAANVRNFVASGLAACSVRFALHKGPRLGGKRTVGFQ